MVQLDADDANSSSAASATHSHAIDDMPQLNASCRTSAAEDDHGHNVGIDIDAGDGSSAVSGDVPSCAVCTEPLDWAAVGPCGHRVVCSACAAHVRSAPNSDHRCCICRTICPTVVVTKAAPAEVAFSTLPAAARHDGRVGEYWYCAAFSAYVDDEQQYEAAKAVASRRHGEPAMVHRAVLYACT